MSHKIDSQIESEFEAESEDSGAPAASGQQAGRPNQNVVVVFKMSADRAKAKREAAKARRGFIRDRLRERSSG